MTSQVLGKCLKVTWQTGALKNFACVDGEDKQVQTRSEAKAEILNNSTRSIQNF
jgi:hypothetical protein